MTIDMKKLSVFIGIFISLLILHEQSSKPVYAATGWQAQPGEGSAEAWQINCNHYDTCQHWTKMTKDIVKTLVNNGYVYGSAARSIFNTSTIDTTLNQCSNDDYLIVSYVPNIEISTDKGQTFNKSGHGGIVNFYYKYDYAIEKESPLTYKYKDGKKYGDLIKYKVDDYEGKDSIHGTYDLTKQPEERRRDIMNDPATKSGNNSNTIKGLLDLLKKDKTLKTNADNMYKGNHDKVETTLVGFCNAMTEEYTEENAGYNVFPVIEIDGKKYEGQGHTVLIDTSSIDIQLGRYVVRDNSKYDSWYDVSRTITIGSDRNYEHVENEKKRNFDDYVTRTINFNDGETEKKVCIESTITPQQETWKNGKQEIVTPYSIGKSCVTIKRGVPQVTGTAKAEVKIIRDNVNVKDFQQINSDSISTENSDTTNWDFEFHYIVTLSDGSVATVTKSSGCPSEITCQFEEDTSRVSMTTGGSRTRIGTITITNPDGTHTFSTAIATVSKSTSIETSQNKENSIVYSPTCYTSTSSPVIINKQDDTAYANFYVQGGTRKTSINSYQQDIQNYIKNKIDPEATAYFNSNVGSVKISQPGKTEEIKYSDFKNYYYTITYEKITKTTTNESGETKTFVSYTNFNHNGPHESPTGQITCPSITAYRETEIQTTQIKISLSTTSQWSKDNKTRQISGSATSSEGANTVKIEDKIYTESENGNQIKLDYTYTLNYKWYDNTYNKRMQKDNKIEWQSGDNPLFTYELEASNAQDYKDEIEPDLEVTNSEGEPANNDGADKITIGSYQDYCRYAESANEYKADYNTDPTPSEKSKKAEICATVYRPWNYNLSFTSIESTSNGGKIYAGNNTTVTVELKNENNFADDSNQEGNPSYSPETQIKLYQIILKDSYFTDPNIDTKGYIATLNTNLISGNPLTQPDGVTPLFSTQISNPACKTSSNEDVLECKLTLDPDTTGNGTTKSINISNINMNDVTNGDHVCLYATMNHTNSKDDTLGTYYGTPKDTNTTYSDFTCFTVTGLPTFQIRGGSINAGGDVKAKVAKSGDNYFGSWVDYGLVAGEGVKELSSGKAFIGEEYTYPDNHPLTIANDTPDNSDPNEPKGQSGINTTATKNNLKTLYSPGTQTEIDSADINLSNSNNYQLYTSNQFTTVSSNPDSKYRYTRINNELATITQGSSLAKGVTHVIYSTGNIVIGSNLTYTDVNMSQITDIPQYIIISEKNIYIDKNVSEVHAWLIADGEINTCSGYTTIDKLGNSNNGLHQASGYNSASYYSGVCDTALSIYGPVFAQNIWLERTSIGGSRSTSGVSELINLTAENYYWALAKAKESNKISTAYTRSLAPRY